jgi:hypothetical protein
MGSVCGWASFVAANQAVRRQLSQEQSALHFGRVGEFHSNIDDMMMSPQPKMWEHWRNGPKCEDKYDAIGPIRCDERALTRRSTIPIFHQLLLKTSF